MIEKNKTTSKGDLQRLEVYNGMDKRTSGCCYFLNVTFRSIVYDETEVNHK